MLNYLKQKFLGPIEEALISKALSNLLHKARVQIKIWKVGKFWRPFIDQPLHIVFPEYPAEEKSTGHRWWLSRGTVFSLIELRDFCEKLVRKREDIRVIGDKSKGLSKSAKNVIILGTPDVNEEAKLIYDKLQEKYKIPYKIVLDEELGKWQIITDEKPFSPEVEGNQGTDYALVIKACYQDPPEKWALMIFGCHMWGTGAASSAVVEQSILNAITKQTNNASYIAFIIKTNVHNNVSKGPDLDIDNQRYIQRLEFKQKKSS